MKDNLDNHIEKLIDKSVKKAALEKPSLGFTNSVMAQIDVLQISTITTYRPLISKPVWIAIFALTLVIVLYIIFGGSNFETGWLNSIDLSIITDNIFSNALSGLKISNTVMYAIVLFGLMLFIQVPILKHHFDKRLEM